jgi:siroheme synthase-like protein
MTFFPIFLDLRDRQVLVVGGGPIATGKVQALVAAGAAVTVVSPQAGAEITNLAATNRVRWHVRAFLDTDVDDMFMVISATDDKALNAQIYQLANAQQRVSNAVDDLENCNFIAPAIARRGDLQVAISTGGTSPALAKQLRDRIADELLTAEAAELAAFLGGWRPAVKAALNTYPRRQAFWEGVLGSCVPGLLASHEHERIATLMGVFLARAGQAANPAARCAAHPEREAAQACKVCRGV